jgi:parvulin-like peptidyl-prolyl isomerase
MKSLALIITGSMTLSVAAWGQVIDRIVASVNDRVITQGEWEEQERFEAMLDGHDPATIALHGATLDRLIDQALVHEQLEALKYEPVSAEEIARHTQELRKQLKITSDHDWQAMLERYGLAEDDFQRHFAEQLNTLRLVDLRFRPAVQVTSLRVQQYYTNTFVPKMQMQGTPMEKIPKLRTSRRASSLS